MIGGIVGYGAYVPLYRITVEEIAQARGQEMSKIAVSLAVHEKSVPGKDEDSVTMAVHAAQHALQRANILAPKIGAIYMGSESHPYAVKPSSTLVGQALGVGQNYLAADMEFACKGGTAALQVSLGVVNAGMCEYALAIGADTAQAAPGDILEYVAGAGSAAFIVSKNHHECAVLIENTLSVSSDTPDFWRRAHEHYPQHAGRFTAEPAYFQHVVTAAQNMLKMCGAQPRDFHYVIFHQPNGKFPLMAAKKLGFTAQQYQPGLLVESIGNSYSANSLLGLTAVLDHALPNQKILLVSYGSGAGCDALVMTTTEKLLEIQGKATQTCDYINRKKYITYGEYHQHRTLAHE